MTHQSPRTPKWVWAVIVVLAMIEPATHVWIAYFPPPDTAPTGLHNPDSAVFLHSMRMFRTGFYSPYASCGSPYGNHYAGYFSVPSLWLYGVVGAIGDLAGCDTLPALGIANGLGAFAYLCAVYAFLREAAPRQANLAFLLFAVGGGPGGVLYLLTGALGLHAAAGFDAYFLRYAEYELMEGGLSPVPLAMRLYYTAPLALCYGALALWIRAVRLGNAWRFGPALALMLLGTFLNIRVGPFLWLVGGFWMWFQASKPVRSRLYATAALAAATGVGAFAALGMMRSSPIFVRSTLDLGRVTLHLSSFISAVLPFMLVVPGEIRRGIRGLPRLPRMAACALAGYLLAFGLLFCAYQIYYGNVLVVRDFAVAVAISDWALIGAALGLVFAVIFRRPAGERPQNGWAILWFMLFLSLAISAFGRGWFMRFGPQRLAVMLGVPLGILAASGLQRMRGSRPRMAKALTGMLVGCGACSIVVGSLFFQGPLNRTPGKGPFAYCSAGIMSASDARVLDALGSGVVLTPATSGPAFGDVVGLRDGNRVINGHGAMNLSDVNPVEIESETSIFFAAGSSDAFRREFVAAYCVDYIYCPATHPVDDAVLSQFYTTPWIEEVARQNKAVLFKVVDDEHDRAR